jgi:hypothetical protein
MTTKFSRNRARVQPTPKVCKSPKRIAPPTPPAYPPTAAINFAWTALNAFFQPTTLLAGIRTATGNGAGIYTWTGTDQQGHATTITITMVIGATITVTVAIASYTPTPNQWTATSGAWNGITPFTASGSLTPKAGLFGSGTWSISV